MHKSIFTTVLVGLFFLLPFKTFAYFTIAADNIKSSKHIHLTYFRTPHNEPLKVRARLYAGHMQNQFCIKQTALNNIGFDKVRTGTALAFDAGKLKAIIGGGFECLVMMYQHESITADMVRLVWDGKEYIGTKPGMTQVVIH